MSAREQEETDVRNDSAAAASSEVGGLEAGSLETCSPEAVDLLSSGNPSDKSAGAKDGGVSAADSAAAFEEVAIPSFEAVSEERARLKQRKLFRRTFRTTVYAMLVVAAVAVLVATLFLPVLQVSGTSMEPTLEDGDIVVLAKLGDFQTGDLCGLYWQNKLLIKRIIGGPGDVVDISPDGAVSVNGQELNEPYVDALALGQCDIDLPMQVPENRYFVMGDHRETSIDSRTSAIGCIEKDQIVGRILLRVWPLGGFGVK